MNIISQTDHSREFYKVVEKVFVKIKSTINTVFIWVVEEVDNEFVFGIFYIHVSRIA